MSLRSIRAKVQETAATFAPTSTAGTSQAMTDGEVGIIILSKLLGADFVKTN